MGSQEVLTERGQAMTLAALAPKPGWADTFLRAAKTAVQVAIGVLSTNALEWTNLSALKGAGIAALAAGAAVIINKVLDWSNS